MSLDDPHGTSACLLTAGVPLALLAAVVLARWRSNLGLEVAQARKARSIAEAQAAARGHFIAHMAHELRGAISGLAGGLDVLQDMAMAPERQRALIEAMSHSARGIVELCERTMDFERMAIGGVDIQPREVRLHELLDRALTAPRLQAQAKGLALLTEISLDPELLASVDAVRLTQVLQNLVGNAVKFTSRGQVNVVARLERDGHDGRALLVTAVRDTGPGVAHDERTQIFQAFVQGSAGHRVRGGAGLGLSICAQIVEAMGGRIELQSSGPQGSQFGFFVPLDLIRRAPAAS